MTHVTFSDEIEVREYEPEVWVHMPKTAQTRAERKKIDAVLQRECCSICYPSSNVKSICDACASFQQTCNEKLHASGFVVFRKAFEVDNSTLTEVYETRFNAIFNGVAENGELTYDGKRLQGTGEWRQKIKRQLNRFLWDRAILSEERMIAELYALRSLPDCGRQPRHTDSAPEKSFKDREPEDVPLALLYALENETRLKVWPFNGEFCVINLKKGDMVVFRGDMAHCGFEYKETNTRIHAYIDTNKPGCKRRKGSTWINDEQK